MQLLGAILLAALGLVYTASNPHDASRHVIKERSLVTDCLGKSEICYGDLGCFRTDGPWRDLLKRPCSVIPNSPAAIDTKFELHNIGADPVYIAYDDEKSINQSTFSPDKPTKFICHGFLDDGSKNWIKVMAKELLIQGDYNVIVVDWGAGSGIPYFQATANTRVVGAVLARFIKYLKAKYNLKYEDCHLIGHSLGAHVVSYAGDILNDVGRISGLDPAEPYFDGMDRVVRLDETDAKFVDVIHTDDSSIVGIGFGTKERSGHVDFFPNNGDHQPGCDTSSTVITYVLKGLKEGIRKTFACDHQRAIELFSDSINSKCPFAGFQCSSWDDFLAGKCANCGEDKSKCAYMGFYADQYKFQKTLPAKNPFFLKTGPSLPFCVFNYQVTVQLENHAQSDKQQGHLYLTIHGNTGTIKRHKLNSGMLKMKHTESYVFYFTSRTEVGIIENLEFEWDYESSILDPSTWRLHKLFGKGIKLYLKYVKVNQMDIMDERLKAMDYPSIFCDDKNTPIKEDTATKLLAHNYCK